MADLAANISDMESVLESLPDEEVDSRLAMCKVSRKNLWPTNRHKSEGKRCC